MKYIFINPVVDNMYIKEELDKLLLNNGYSRVEVENDWHKVVKEKYNEALKSTEKVLLDRRCPLAIDTINEYINEQDVFIPKIDPILIHCGIEIANREDLKGKKKVITTPCKSLASYGNKKDLEDTVFISWKEFIKKLNLYEKIQVKLLDESPIPLGYFNSLESKISSISGEENIEAYFKNNLHKESDLVEMLYCKNGCNNGDGVLINE
ncbi:hypothetical protein J0A94_10105 [Paraclostridium bifermentans]|uniref:Iron hydrogenase large subunit C-terminal domain-containing protein n=1 Tax=Paraclostridium bifermentans TaxID=1490 RepID=A0AA44IHJ3_PARBF|nr:hypothetical protein [Paraclostridium bifermentans]MBN8048191.1 hypothetical protein [Paraclostridium bifermentans]NME10060.1 hypothetical protein [Paraclostridium bifermentans]